MKRMSSRTLSTLTLIFLAGVFSTTQITYASHPYHVSNAEVNFNAKTGNFEVALCVWPADLEKAIGIQQQTTIDLDKTEDLDDLMKSYVSKRFLVRPSGPKIDQTSVQTKPNIRWVGHERNLKKAWLYFEVECGNSNSSWTIENRVFFELNEDQLNQLELTIGKQSKIVVCRSGDPRFPVETGVGE